MIGGITGDRQESAGPGLVPSGTVHDDGEHVALQAAVLASSMTH